MLDTAPTRTYDCIPDVDDDRDFLLADRNLETPATGLKVSFRAKMPPALPLNQLQLGSCTANGLVALAMYILGLQAVLSRLFVYYGERNLEGTIGQDAGAQLRDGLKVLATLGAPPETAWPYRIAKFAMKPSLKAFKAALAHRIGAYHRVIGVDEIRAALAAGLPVVIGIPVYESFESTEVAQTGTVPMPAHGEKLLGGHATLVTGCDDDTQLWEVLNSWGADWGDGGWFTLPYAYTISDAWVMSPVTAKAIAAATISAVTRCVVGARVPGFLANGRPYAPGEVVDADPVADADLIATGALHPAAQPHTNEETV